MNHYYKLLHFWFKFYTQYEPIYYIKIIYTLALMPIPVNQAHESTELAIGRTKFVKPLVGQIQQEEKYQTFWRNNVSPSIKIWNHVYFPSFNTLFLWAYFVILSLNSKPSMFSRIPVKIGLDNHKFTVWPNLLSHILKLAVILVH